MQARLSPHPFLPLLPIILLAGCSSGVNSSRLEYQMGDRIPVGQLTYNVIETAWQSQLGGEFNLRLPEQRFLLITVQVTNGAGREISVPLFTVEASNGKQYTESDNGEGVDTWFGLLRNLNPAQTQQGRLLFDVPLGTYRLRLTDGGELGSEKFVWVSIPLRIDPETFSSPLPESPPGK